MLEEVKAGEAGAAGEDYEPTYELRPLTARDSKKLRDMLLKVRKHEELKTVAREQGLEAAQGVALDVLLNELEEEFIPWMYSLVGKTPEQFEETEPFGAEFALANDLMRHPDFLRVLKLLSSLVAGGKRISGLFASRSKSDSDSPTETS